MNKNNKEIEFNPDDLVKNVESFAQHIKNVYYEMYYLKEDLNEYKEINELQHRLMKNAEERGIKKGLQESQEELQKYKSFVNSLLNPEEYGYAVSAEVRDQARILLGMKPVESKLKK
jgi:hypothetical protein